MTVVHLSLCINKGLLIHLINNSAETGGGMYLAVNPKLYLLKSDEETSYTRRNKT